MLIKRHCEWCDDLFFPDRETGRYCKDACRLAAWHERQKSPLWKAAKALAKAKTMATPSEHHCLICKSQACITDGRFTLCQAGHLCSLNGLYRESGTGIEGMLWRALVGLVEV